MTLPDGAVALAAPRMTRAAADTATLRFVPQADLAVLDPVFTIAYVTRNHDASRGGPANADRSGSVQNCAVTGL